MDVIKQTKQTNKQEEITTYNTSKQSTGTLQIIKLNVRYHHGEMYDTIYTIDFFA
jgi:hypothetical protein